jgi:ApaG protein
MTSREDVKIEVNTRYLQEQSDPDGSRYVFAYTVEISNKGSQAIKLLNRHWHITDDNNKVEEVRGDGVIGQQPEILPGQSFHYTSPPMVKNSRPRFLLSYWPCPLPFTDRLLPRLNHRA